MAANDNEPAYFSCAVLERALIMRQRLRIIARQRRRALAAGRRPPPPLGHEHERETSDWHYEPRPLLTWPCSWDDMGLLNQYGVVVLATLTFCLVTLHILHVMMTG